MIKNIILDVGNVLVDYCWKSYIDSLGFSEETAKRVAAATVLSQTWDEYDRGVLTDEEVLNRFIKNDPAIEKELRIFSENLSGIIKEFPYTRQWILDLKAQGFKVYILSNFGSKCMRECKDEMGFVPLVDGALFSYEEKVVKPDDAIYQKLYKRFHLKPEECLFFDDREDNIKAAIENGMQGIVFKSYEQAKEAIVKSQNEP